MIFQSLKLPSLGFVPLSWHPLKLPCDRHSDARLFPVLGPGNKGCVSPPFVLWKAPCVLFCVAGSWKAFVEQDSQQKSSAI